MLLLLLRMKAILWTHPISSLNATGRDKKKKNEQLNWKAIGTTMWVWVCVFLCSSLLLVFIVFGMGILFYAAHLIAIVFACPHPFTHCHLTFFICAILQLSMICCCFTILWFVVVLLDLLLDILTNSKETAVERYIHIAFCMNSIYHSAEMYEVWLNFRLKYPLNRIIHAWLWHSHSHTPSQIGNADKYATSNFFRLYSHSMNEKEIWLVSITIVLYSTVKAPKHWTQKSRSHNRWISMQILNHRQNKNKNCIKLL